MQTERPLALADYALVTPCPIQWGDQDAYGHVNNTVYFRWYETARIDYMRQPELSSLLKQHGINPILASISCQYRRQLTFPDTIHIGTRVTGVGNSSLKISHAIYSEVLGEIAAEGESVVVAFDYQANKSVRVPDDFRAALEKIEGRSLA